MVILPYSSNRSKVIINLFLNSKHATSVQDQNEIGKNIWITHQFLHFVAVQLNLLFWIQYHILCFFSLQHQREPFFFRSQWKSSLFYNRAFHRLARVLQLDLSSYQYQVSWKVRLVSQLNWLFTIYLTYSNWSPCQERQ